VAGYDSRAAMRPLIVLLLLALAVAGCGAKGGLYLPPPDGETAPGSKKK